MTRLFWTDALPAGLLAAAIVTALVFMGCAA